MDSDLNQKSWIISFKKLFFFLFLLGTVIEASILLYSLMSQYWYIEGTLGSCTCSCSPCCKPLLPQSQVDILLPPHNVFLLNSLQVWTWPSHNSQSNAKSRLLYITNLFVSIERWWSDSKKRKLGCCQTFTTLQKKMNMFKILKEKNVSQRFYNQSNWPPMSKVSNKLIDT